MIWSTADIADAVEAGLKLRARADDDEQAVYGFDALDELGLHPLIRQSLEAPGFGVWPEQRYPDDQRKSKRSEGKRCDLVLTPAPDALPLRDPQIEGTLFDSAPAADVSEAYWLEIKTVSQFTKDGPFKRYSSELLSPVTQDVKKLWTDSRIIHAGLLLVLFTVSQPVAEHDTQTWHRRCLDRGLPVSPPATRGFAITDRIGNAWCQLSVFAVRCG